MATETSNLKRAAAEAAIKLVESTMTVGLGTGSTAGEFIALLGEKVRDGFDVTGIPTSEDTRRKALAAGIELAEIDETTVIDIAVDGADEIDMRRQLIKGGGGALMREKIVAHAARRFVVIADASKEVAVLGAFPLPIEIDKAMWPLTVRALRDVLIRLGYERPPLALRPAAPQSAGFFETDGGHLILDCKLWRISDAAGLDAALRSIPGVIETGLFINRVNDAFIARTDGVAHLVGP